MPNDEGRRGLRAARTARGWSQAEAARELVELGRARGIAVAAAASLKTLLSRWENGHSVPEQQYRLLLGELYGRGPTELGLADPAESERPASAARLPAALAEAAAAHGSGLELWWQQLALARELDDELGAAGAGELVRAQVQRLDETLTHTPSPSARSAVAAVLAGAAALAGAQSLDGSHHDEAWRSYDRARSAAREAELPVAAAVAVSGQAAVLLEVGEVESAIALLEETARAATDGARVRLDAALAIARAAAGEDGPSRASLAAAESGLRHRRADIVRGRDGPPVELADLDRWHGRALVALGAPDAVAPLRRALAAHPRSARHRAAVHADLALALEAGHPHEAADHAMAARKLASGIGSERIPARLSALGAKP